MKKYLWIILVVGILTVGGFAFFYFSTNHFNTKSPYTAEKSMYTTIPEKTTNTLPKVKTIEEELSTFSTKITNQRDLNRQGNITITCSKLNNTIIEPNEIFSFCDIIGESTREKGYKEANVIIQGVETKGLGGR